MTDYFLVTRGDYEDEHPVGLFSSLKLAQGQYPVNLKWEGEESGEFWDASIYTMDKRPDGSEYRRYSHSVQIYRLELDKEIPDA